MSYGCNRKPLALSELKAKDTALPTGCAYRKIDALKSCTRQSQNVVANSLKDMNSYIVETRKLKIEEYQALRKTTGWDSIEDDIVEIALEKDLFSICVFDKEKVIGIGRVIGDGAIYFYIQDIIVLPEYRGKGIGRLIMDNVEGYLSKAANNNSFIGLMAAEGVKGFYGKYGYDARQETKPGMYKIMKKKMAAID